MRYDDISERSAKILLSYYDNDIEPFLDACHPDVLWIGPGEGQIIKTQATLRSTFASENNTLKFRVHDLSVTTLPTSSPSVFEAVMMFLVDTIWPDGTIGRVNQRIHLSWVGCRETPRILLCHISNAIAYDQRDTIYPVHYTETFGTEMHYAGTPASGRICLRTKGHTTVYIAHDRIIYAESHNRHTIVHTPDGTYEATESLSTIARLYEDLLVRCHASYLVNPAYVTGVSRFQAELEDGRTLPIPEKRYTAVRALLERGMGRKSRPGEPA